MKYWFIEADGYWYTFLTDGSLGRYLSEDSAKFASDETDKFLSKKESQVQDSRFAWYAIRDNWIGG